VLKQLGEQQACDLTGVVDIRHDRLTSESVEGLRVGTKLDTFLDDCDAVDVVTPTDTHYGIVERCLSAGKDVFVEKPLALRSSEASKLVELAQKNERILAVGHILRYHPCISKVKSIVRRDGLGPLKLLDGRYLGTRGPRTDSGVLMNLAIHLVDLYNFLLEENPKEVSAYLHQLSNASRFEDHAVLTLTYPSGSVGHMTVSWLSAQKTREILVAGDSGALCADLVRSELVMSEKSSPAETAMTISGAEPLLSELTDFINCLGTRAKPLNDGKSAVVSIRILEKAHEANELGRPVTLD
jgi:predicted dehydrogenase